MGWTVKYLWMTLFNIRQHCCVKVLPPSLKCIRINRFSLEETTDLNRSSMNSFYVWQVTLQGRPDDDSFAAGWMFYGPVWLRRFEIDYKYFEWFGRGGRHQRFGAFAERGLISTQDSSSSSSFLVGALTEIFYEEKDEFLLAFAWRQSWSWPSQLWQHVNGTSGKKQICESKACTGGGNCVLLQSCWQRTSTTAQGGRRARDNQRMKRVMDGGVEGAAGNGNSWHHIVSLSCHSRFDRVTAAWAQPENKEKCHHTSICFKMHFTLLQGL